MPDERGRLSEEHIDQGRTEPERADRAEGPRELARRPGASLGRSLALTATAMLAPPVIAAIAGGLALGIVVGVLSIFGGLLGFLAFVHGTERPQRQPPARLPRAQVRPRLRG